MKKTTFIKLAFVVTFLSLSLPFSAQTLDTLALNQSEITALHSTGVNALVDRNTNTTYSFNDLPNVVVFHLSKTYVIKTMSITSSVSSADRDPKDIELSASHDGINWTVLRTNNGMSFTARKQIKTVTVNATQAYAYFRLKITAVALANSKVCSIGEFMLVGEEKILSATPTDFRANPLAHNEVKLSWRDRASDEDGYEIQRSSNGTTFTSIATGLPANTTTYTDNTVNANTFYVYRVMSFKGKGTTALKSVYATANRIITPVFPLKNLLTSGRTFTPTTDRTDSPTDEGIANAFDDDANTKFLSRAVTTWLKVAFNEPLCATQYCIASANDAAGRDPKAWKIEGSDNGTSGWVTLDTRTNQTFDARFQKRYFEFANTVAYKYYRLSITANAGDGMTQLADWLLYGNEPIGTEQITLASPTHFQIDNRAWHYVRLSWNDVANETSYRIERYENGEETMPYVYEIPANNTEAHPYSLKANTNYEFKIYAVNGENISAPATASVITKEIDFPDTYTNYHLWTLDHLPNSRGNFTKVKQIDNVAFYMLDGYTDASGTYTYNVNNLEARYYEWYARNWNYVYSCYPDLSDSTMQIMIIPTEDGGGVASINDYRSSGCNYRNQIYIKGNKNWFKQWQESGYIYDVPSHEFCHIIEGVGGGYNGSMFYPIWGDSKWSEVLQIDEFRGTGSPRATTWHNEYMNGAGGADYPNADRINYWYRDFWYPTYDAYGATDVLKRFWQLNKQYYRQKNGSFQGNGSNPGGRGNLGELIHFWSGACQTDVKPFAVKAFGWNEQYESWLAQAKIDYPQITYAEAPIDNSYKNLCQNGGKMQSNYEITKSNLQKIIDNNYGTYFNLRSNVDMGNWELTYVSATIAIVDKYVIVSNNTQPQSWVLYGSNTGNDWTAIDTQNTPVFTSNKSTVSLPNNTAAYRYYKFNFTFPASNQITLYEIELYGTEQISTPYDLVATRVTDTSVLLDWSCEIDEIGHLELERSTNGNDFAKIANLTPYDITYTDENLTTGTYYYRVKMVNKSLAKGTMYSNIAFVNTTAGIEDNSTSDESFYKVLNNLSDYQVNNVEVYTANGQKVFDENYQHNDLLPHLQSKLSSGIYITKIKFNGGTVTGKIVVK